MSIAASIALALAVHATLGQSPTFRDQSSKTTIRSASALVIVPTLVQSLSGELVGNLDESHFRLSDNGIEQKVFVEQALNQPLAIVVLVQNGGVASGQLRVGKAADLESQSGNERAVDLRRRDGCSCQTTSPCTS